MCDISRERYKGARKGKNKLERLIRKVRAANEKFAEESQDLERKIRAANEKFEAELQALERKVRAGNGEFIAEFQRVLYGLEDTTLPSIEENRALVDSIDWLMRRLRLRLACAREGCGEPSYLRCAVDPSRPYAGFTFDHRDEGLRKNHLRRPTLPRLKLIPQSRKTQ